MQQCVLLSQITVEDRADEMLGLSVHIGDWLKNMKRITWYKKLYLSENAKKKHRKIMWKVKHKAGMIDTYLITVPRYGTNQLEIINSSELLQKHYDGISTYVVGIAIGYEQALKLVEKIVMDVLKETKQVRIREYFEKDFMEIQ